MELREHQPLKYTVRLKKKPLGERTGNQPFNFRSGKLEKHGERSTKNKQKSMEKRNTEMVQRHWASSQRKTFPVCLCSPQHAGETVRRPHLQTFQRIVKLPRLSVLKGLCKEHTLNMSSKQMNIRLPQDLHQTTTNSQVEAQRGPKWTTQWASAQTRMSLKLLRRKVKPATGERSKT